MTGFTPILIFLVATTLTLGTSAYFWRRARAVSVFTLAWYLAAVGLNALGIFPGNGTWVAGDVLRMMAYSTAMFAPVAVYFWVRARSATLRAALEAVPAPLLAATQVYRVSGATFWLAYLAGIFPGQVAIPAAILDSFIGLTALPVAYLMLRGPARGLSLAWNGLGLFDFAVAFTVISASIFGLWSLAPAPSAIGQARWILISTFQVPFAIIVHAELIRRALQASSPAAQAAAL